LCLPAILACRHLGAIEFGNDLNGPGVAARIACGRMVQAQGLALQMGSWNMPLPLAEMQQIVSALDPRGLLVRFQTQTLDEARQLNELVCAWAAAR
jgi:hypothetical protein